MVPEYLSPESESLKVTEPTAKWRGKHKLIEYKMKERRKKIKTWESRPSIGLNYLLLIRISNNIHEVPGCWSPWYWGPSSPDKIIVRFSGLTKGVMLLLIGCKTGGQFEFKSSIWKLKSCTNVFHDLADFNSIVPKWNMKARTLQSYPIST